MTQGYSRNLSVSNELDIQRLNFATQRALLRRFRRGNSLRTNDARLGAHRGDVSMAAHGASSEAESRSSMTKGNGLMRITNRLKIIAVTVIAGAAMFAAAPAVAAPSGPYTCTGGDIPSGTYSTLTIAGVCTVPEDAVITVTGNVIVNKDAVLDAQSAPSTITIGGNVVGLTGSTVGLGCQPPSLTGNSAHPCTTDPEGYSTIEVGGNISTTNAATVLLNGITVKKNVSLVGGGSPIPWSIKNNTISGNLSISGQTTEWVGVLFNNVGGNVSLVNITLTDSHPDNPGVYVVRNTVARNLVCQNLVPGVSGGFVPGSVNVVGGNAVGQCAALV